MTVANTDGYSGISDRAMLKIISGIAAELKKEADRRQWHMISTALEYVRAASVKQLTENHRTAGLAT